MIIGLEGNMSRESNFPTFPLSKILEITYSYYPFASLNIDRKRAVVIL